MNDVKMMKNVVVEVVSDEDGDVSVNVCGLSDWGWLGLVWSGKNGGVEDVEVDGCLDVYGEELWKVYEEKISGEFDEYKKSEDDWGWYNDDVNWEDIKREFMLKCKEVFGDGMGLSYVKVGGYSVECDNEFVVIIGKL